jgi:hypothetical protein
MAPPTLAPAASPTTPDRDKEMSSMASISAAAPPSQRTVESPTTRTIARGRPPPWSAALERTRVTRQPTVRGIAMTSQVAK